MISNQILQKTIDELKNIIRRDLSIIGNDGNIVVTTEELHDDELDIFDEITSSHAEFQCIHGCLYFKVFDENVCEYIIKIIGEDDESVKLGKLVAFHIYGLVIAYKERYDKDNFIKNLLLDNLLRVDIYNRSKKLHIKNDVRRIVYLIETSADYDLIMLDVVRDIFPAKLKDFIAAIDENNIILVKELQDEETMEDIERFAKMIFDTISDELLPKVYISIGTVVCDLKDISRSYKDAKMALEVGKIFESSKNIINYDSLGLGRLIYQLPPQLCRVFEKEVLHGLNADDFDEETLTTVDKFFENNLNVSETSRQLNIHRNTLVYRIDKLQKMTGLDLRNFDDAIIFKITLMVNKYMDYMDRLMY